MDGEVRGQEKHEVVPGLQLLMDRYGVQFTDMTVCAQAKALALDMKLTRAFPLLCLSHCSVFDFRAGYELFVGPGASPLALSANDMTSSLNFGRPPKMMTNVRSEQSGTTTRVQRTSSCNTAGAGAMSNRI